MKKPWVLLFLILVIIANFPIQAKKKTRNHNQQVIIQGKVQDILHEPLEGVLVSLKSREQMSFTNSRGQFVLKVSRHLKSLTLLFTHERFHPYTLRLKPEKFKKPLSVVLIPKEYIQEEVSITALNREEKRVDVPSAESSVSELEIKEKIPENIVTTMLNTPGIHFIGSGGFSITPSIRGIARRRVLILVDGMRVTGDRRAGVSAGFLAPELIKKIEMVRSSSSVLYGSDAIGGVIQLLTHTPQTLKSLKNSLNLSLSSGNQRINSGLKIQQTIAKINLSAAFQITSADNYSTPIEEVFHSGFTYYSGMFSLQTGNEKRAFSLSYIGGQGNNIGKPNRDNDPDSYTRIADEGEHFIRFHYVEKKILTNGQFDLLLYVNPSLYSLEKYKSEASSKEYSRIQGYNLGGKVSFKKTLNKNLSIQSGLEWFGRRDFDFENKLENSETVEFSFPLLNGKRNDYSLYFTADYRGIPTVDILGGIRYTWFSLQATVEDTVREKQTNAPSYFLGLTKKFGKTLSLFLNLGRAFRLPGLSESFYTGLTGRKYVIGNPNLIAERSFNLDWGIKFFSRKFFLGAYLFNFRIEDMIERYKNDEGIYTYDNINRGNIYGGEMEFQLFPLKNLEIFGHFFYYKGRSSTLNEPLNDIPSPKVLLGGKLLIDRFWAEINFLHSYKKSDPGPAEVENDSYSVVNVKAGYYFSTHLYLNVKVANFFNELYFPNPDPDIPSAKGINLSLGIHYYF